LFLLYHDVDILFFNIRLNHISGVNVSVIASECGRSPDGFESISGHTKDYEIGICCFSAKHVAVRRKSKDWLGFRIMCPSGATLDTIT
jgi:hypothetical protein